MEYIWSRKSNIQLSRYSLILQDGRITTATEHEFLEQIPLCKHLRNPL